MAKKYSIAEARAAVHQKRLKAKKGTFEVGLPHESLTRHGGRNSRGIRGRRRDSRSLSSLREAAHLSLSGLFRVAQLARLPAMRPRGAALDPVASGDSGRRAGGGGAVRPFFHDLVVAFAVSFAVTILVLGVPLWGGWWIGKVMKLEPPLEARKPATWSVNELER
jgi:hypothetical protein